MSHPGAKKRKPEMRKNLSEIKSIDVRDEIIFDSDLSSSDTSNLR